MDEPSAIDEAQRLGVFARLQSKPCTLDELSWCGLRLVGVSYLERWPRTAWRPMLQLAVVPGGRALGATLPPPPPAEL